MNDKVCFVEVKQEFDEINQIDDENLDITEEFNECCNLCDEIKDLRNDLRKHLDDVHCK